MSLSRMAVTQTHCYSIFNQWYRPWSEITLGSKAPGLCLSAVWLEEGHGTCRRLGVCVCDVGMAAPAPDPQAVSRGEGGDPHGAHVSQTVGHSGSTITAVNTTLASSTHCSASTRVCWWLGTLSKYCQIGFLNDSVSIYPVSFMCWMLEKLNKYL